MTFVKSSTAAALLSSATLAPPPPVEGSQTRIGPPAEQLTERERTNTGGERVGGAATDGARVDAESGIEAAGGVGLALGDEAQDQDEEEGDSLRGGGTEKAPDPLALSQLPMALPRFTKRDRHSAAYYTIGRPPRPRVWG